MCINLLFNQKKTYIILQKQEAKTLNPYFQIYNTFLKLYSRKMQNPQMIINLHSIRIPSKYILTSECLQSF